MSTHVKQYRSSDTMFNRSPMEAQRRQTRQANVEVIDDAPARKPAKPAADVE